MENNLGNKQTMAKNLKRYMDLKKVNATQICKTLGFPNASFSDWLNAKTYPRIDKIEKLALFFGIDKADLIEEHKWVDRYDLLQIFAEQKEKTTVSSDLESMSDEELDNLFMQLFRNKDKEYLLNLAYRILDLASKK